MIEVFLIDDHPFVIQGLKSYLETHEQVEIVGTAKKGIEGKEQIKKLKPQVAVVDLRLSDISGIEITREIKESDLSVEVIILSSFSEEQEVIEAIDAGALSYLMKDSPPEKLAEAILAAGRGESVLSPRITKKLMKRATSEQPVIDPLTDREEEVLSCLVSGSSNKEIADKLNISITTVKTHVSNILRKLEVEDRTQAAIKAIDNNLVSR